MSYAQLRREDSETSISKDNINISNKVMMKINSLQESQKKTDFELSSRDLMFLIQNSDTLHKIKKKSKHNFLKSMSTENIEGSQNDLENQDMKS